jgi:integral membrane protein
MPGNPLVRLRWIGLAEGVSFLVLLGVAMPLKYLAHMPGAVKYVGWIHGLLFILYVAALGQATATQLWSPLRAALLFVAAVVPGGTFVADRWLRRQVPQPATSDPRCS